MKGQKSLQKTAVPKVAKALKDGVLIRGSKCCLCDRKEGDYALPKRMRSTRPGSNWGCIVAHHWKGYNHPLDVVWVCRSCNVMLKDRVGMSVSQMKEFIRQRKLIAETKKNNSHLYNLYRKYVSKESCNATYNEWLVSQGVLHRSDLNYFGSPGD